MDKRKRGVGPKDDLCILISTCDAYKELASWTAKTIDRYWRPHPRVFFCGSRDTRDGVWIPMTRDPVDWMGITLDAAAALQERGYKKCYLVLDDHAPVFSCHASHLNDTIPYLMDKIDATYIGLNGWGQPGREKNGKVLGQDFYYIENVSPDYPWKYQLHPGLWCLSSLIEILKTLTRQLPIEKHNPWSFERRSGEAGSRLQENLKRRAYP